MDDKPAAICGFCGKSTDKVYSEYTCADCHISAVEEALETQKKISKELSAEVKVLEREVQANEDSRHYKIAFEKLVSELRKEAE